MNTFPLCIDWRVVCMCTYESRAVERSYRKIEHWHRKINHSNTFLILLYDQREERKMNELKEEV